MKATSHHWYANEEFSMKQNIHKLLWSLWFNNQITSHWDWITHVNDFYIIFCQRTARMIWIDDTTTISLESYLFKEFQKIMIDSTETKKWFETATKVIPKSDLRAIWPSKFCILIKNSTPIANWKNKNLQFAKRIGGFIAIKWNIS